MNKEKICVKNVKRDTLMKSMDKIIVKNVQKVPEKKSINIYELKKFYISYFLKYS